MEAGEAISRHPGGSKRQRSSVGLHESGVMYFNIE